MTSAKITESQLALMKARESLKLSREYAGIARSLTKDPRSIRGVIDTGYNSVELCAKGLLWLKLKRIPKTHKGIVQKFGQLYVKTDKIEKDIGRSLNKALLYRNFARYETNSKPTKIQVQEVLRLLGKLQMILKVELNRMG